MIIYKDDISHKNNIVYDIKKIPLIPSLLRAWSPTSLSYCLVVQFNNCHNIICNIQGEINFNIQFLIL